MGLPLVAGLDLSWMGIADPHRAWGMAAALIPRNLVVDAIAHHEAAITPVVDWSILLPPRQPSPPVLNERNSVVVALAVTWPSGVQPTAVQLHYLGTRGSVDGGTGHGRPAESIDLLAPLPPLVGPLGAQLDHGDREPDRPWELLSGTFFLPPSELPSKPAGWLRAGWAVGPYAFVVTRSDGSITTLPFAIGN